MSYSRFPAEGGIPTYPTASALPTGVQDGSTAVTLDTDNLWIYNAATQTWLTGGGPTTVLTVGTYGSQTPSANAAVISANTLFLQSASGTVPGCVSIGAQTLAGAKTFSDTVLLNGTQSASNAAATVSYVNSVASGLEILAACYATTTANLSATYSNGTAGVGATLTNSGSLAAFSVDGQSPSINSRILVKNQSTAAQNGIYLLTTVGSGAVAWVLTRSADYDQVAEIVPGTLIPVETGTQYGLTSWLQTATVSTIGTDSINFSEFSSATGATTIVTLGTVTTGTWNASTIGVAYGGTGLTSYTTGDLLYASASGTIAGLADAATGNVLLSGGVGAAPTYGKVSLTSAISGILPVANGGTGVSSVTIVPTASAWAGWDANLNLSVNNMISGYTTIASAAGTTTLTVASPGLVYITGITTQTVKMPVVSTLVLGQTYTIVNRSSGSVTVKSSGSNTIQTMAANTQCILTVTAITGTDQTSWDVLYYAFSSGGSVTSVAASVPSFLSISGSPITSTGTLAITYSGTALPVANGGTGLTSYTTGDLLYASGSGTLAGLADAATGNVLLSGGAGVAPSYGKVSLTAAVSGILPVANGGTGASLANTSGAILYNTGTQIAQVSPSATANQILYNGGNGTFSWSLPTYPTATGTSELLYSSSANTIASLATGNSGVLITSSGGVPSISSTIPSATQDNITRLGTVTSGTWSATTVAINKGGTGVTSVTTSPTASAWAGWDANSNFSSNSMITGYATTATSGGTTTLTVASKQLQYFTGGLTHLVNLPAVSTLVNGQQFKIVSTSSGTVTVQYASAAGTMVVLTQNFSVKATVIDKTAGEASAWGWLLEPVQSYIPGFTSVTQNSIIVGSTSNQWVQMSPVSGGILNYGSAGGVNLTVTPVIGIAGTSTGTLGLSGVTSGVVTIQPVSAAGTYNFNLPITAGSSGQPLLSGGGGSTAQTYGTLGVAAGGTGQTSYTDGQLLIGATSGNTLAKATLTGTANQVVVTNGTSSITLSTPQSIATSSAVQFGTLAIGASLVSNSTTSITATTSTILAITGTQTNSANQFGINLTNTMKPGNTANQKAMQVTTTFDTTTSAFANAIGLETSLTIQGAGGNAITQATGIYIAGITGSTAPVTSAYGIYCINPGYGTAQYTAYFDLGVGIGTNDANTAFIVGNNKNFTTTNTFGSVFNTLMAGTDNCTTASEVFISPSVSITTGKIITNFYGLELAGPVSSGSGTVTNSYSLAVFAPSGSNSTNKYTAYFDAGVGIGNSNAGGTHALIVTGTAGLSTGTLWTNTSDIRIKRDVIDTEEALPVINSLRPRKFHYTHDYLSENKLADKEYYGFIANEVEEILPSCVRYSLEKIGNKENLKVLDLHNVNILMVKAVKELSSKIIELEKKLELKRN